MTFLPKISSLLSRDVKLTFSFFNPSRQDVLLEKAEKSLKKTGKIGNYDRILACTKALSNRDFVIFANPENETEFIQCTLDQGEIIVDYPYSVIDGRSRLTHRLDYILYKQGFSTKPRLLAGVFFGSREGYFQHSQSSYGCGYDINCGRNYGRAAKLMHTILVVLYDLEPEFPLDIKIE